MKQHLRGAVRVAAVLSTTAALALLPVAAAEAAAKIIADLPAFPDRQYSSPRVCAHQQGKIWRVGQNESSTIRGVKVQVCRVHSDGSDQHCETKQYISKR